jgi:hypothetical protein
VIRSFCNPNWAYLLRSLHVMLRLPFKVESNAQRKNQGCNPEQR